MVVALSCRQKSSWKCVADRSYHLTNTGDRYCRESSNRAKGSTCRKSLVVLPCVCQFENNRCKCTSWIGLRCHKVSPNWTLKREGREQEQHKTDGIVTNLVLEALYALICPGRKFVHEMIRANDCKVINPLPISPKCHQTGKRSQIASKGMDALLTWRLPQSVDNYTPKHFHHCA